MKSIRNSDTRLLSRIWQYSKAYPVLLSWGIILTLLLALLAPLRPLLTQYMLDHFITESEQNMLLYCSLLMIAILIVQGIAQYYHSFLTNLLGQKVIRRLRNELFERMLSFKTSFFDKTPVGTSVTRSVSDMETIADIFSEGLIVIIGDLLQLFVIIGVMFWVDWRLALIALSTVPLLALATSVFRKKIKLTFSEVRTQVAALNTFVQEHLTGMRLVQTFHREEQEYKKFEQINARHRDANIKSVWYYSIFFPVVDILSAISIGLIVWWGSGGVIRDEVSFGSLVAFIMYINLLFRPIRELADKFNTLQMGMVSSERIFNLMDTPEVQEATGTIATGRINGEIEFRDVWFAYNYSPENEKECEWILRGISFHVKPGQSLALVGSTGSGKTTIINLINRMYELSRGQILIDGRDIYEYDLHFLRSQIGLVLQDVFLFSDSLEKNIGLGKPDLLRSEIELACRQLSIMPFIEKLPSGLDFQVQERGSLLSQGQRQLISFVRVMVYDPPVLILDEATSSIDSETEYLLGKALEVLSTKRTSLFIAHRLATVRNSDQILVVEKGEIRERGTHEELVSQNGPYRLLYLSQFSESDSVQRTRS